MDTSSPNLPDLVTRDPTPSHHRSPSGGLLSKLSFLRASASDNQTQAEDADDEPAAKSDNNVPSSSPKKPARAMAVAVQQRTRRRRGSLRKTALLGRGAQRERREMETSPLTTGGLQSSNRRESTSPEDEAFHLPERENGHGSAVLNAHEPGHGNDTLPSVPDGNTTLPRPATRQVSSPIPTIYTSTTDEDDGLIIQPPKYPLRSIDSPISSEDGYFGPFLHNSNSSNANAGTVNLTTRRRSTQSPLSKPASSQLATTTTTTPSSSSPLLPNPPSKNWDYSETEWWGWIILLMTWLVFVTGMGSCLGVWSWAWDVGETPYAPPELEDDPTLPIVGYYPALIILTGVMAWVWVVVAWVGMKYFRHARISGD